MNNKQFSFSLTTFSVGIAIFSMFFGAGNVIFPLILGQTTGQLIDIALVGLLLTAIGGPLLGLFATTLYEGDCKQFFSRIGAVPAVLTVLLIIAIIGPFGAMPRCFTVSYAALKPYFPDMSLGIFSVLAGIVTLACIAKRRFILPILGAVLSPLLILCLIIIIVKGFLMPPVEQALVNITMWGAFKEGLSVGFDTMDLLASIFFAVAIWDLLKEKLEESKIIVLDSKSLTKALVPICIVSSLIGGGLLALIYVGLSKVAAANLAVLNNVPKQEVLSQLAIYVLGDKFAFIANVAIALACLTTVISLAVTIADVLHLEFESKRTEGKWKMRYEWLILITVGITVLFTNLGFDKLMSYLHPIIAICYPAIIVLTICNILYKLYGFRLVKIPVYATLLYSIAQEFGPKLIGMY